MYVVTQVQQQLVGSRSDCFSQVSITLHSSSNLVLVVLVIFVVAASDYYARGAFN